MVKELNSVSRTPTPPGLPADLYLSLENLGQAEDYFQAVRTIEAKADAIKDNLPAFEAEWGKASLEYAALDKQARQRDWDRFPAAVRALSESAQGRTIPLLEGSRGFATSTKPQDGLAYMGEAKGEAAYATFLYGLSIARKDAPFPLRSVLPELEALQEKTNAAFQPPRSIDMHPRFINLNATLKFARELDSSKAYAGALYQYLEAARHYGMLDPAVPDEAKQSALRSLLAEELKKVSTSKRDDSIAQIFLEKANGWLNKPEGAAPIPTSGELFRSSCSRCYPHITRRSSPLRHCSNARDTQPRSRWCAGPTLETFLTQQVCWPRKLQQSTREKLLS